MDNTRTREQLISELAQARARIAALAASEAERKRMEEALWEGEKRFRSIAETASDAIIIFDIHENIFFWNKAAQDTFGYWAGETRGRLLASILAQPFLQVVKREIEQAVTTGESSLAGKTTEVTGVRKDKSEFPLEISLATWKVKDEVFFTIIGRDITERKQAKRALEAAYAEMEKRVEERTAALQQEMAERQRAVEERERLQEEVIEAQQRAIRELSTPIIPVMDRVIVMPLVGSIDSLRAKDIMRTLLAGISRYRAKILILDITGVPIVDSGVADHLNKTIQAARLKGAQTIVTGMSDAVAEAVVELGIDWGGVQMLSDLQSGLMAALGSLSIKMTREG